ncbi:hypothetical protein EDB19DRAFT_1645507, partial [Suillus lakei]
PFLTRSLILDEVEAFSFEKEFPREGPGFTRTIVEVSEPGGPAFEYRNVSRPSVCSRYTIIAPYSL